MSTSKQDKQREQLKKLLGEIDDVSSLLKGDVLTPESKTLLGSLLEESIYEQARHDFHIFVRIMAPVLIPEGFKDGAHLRVICNELMALEAGKISRLMVFLPPGAMKSILCSKLFPAWCYGRNPTWTVLQIGHGTQFAEDNFGRPTKDIIQSVEYKRIFPGTSIREDVKAAGRWETDQGGKYFCTGVGGAITGRRGNIVILDDVVTEHTPDSELEKITKDWYGPGLRTRMLPEGKELIVNTRWKTYDLSGYLLEEAKKNPKSTQWKVISVPAILDEQGAKLLGLPVGSSFWPEFWPLERLLELKNDPSMSSLKWQALYMQNPIPEGGNLIKLEWCKLWTDTEASKFGCSADKPPPLDYIVISLDTAFSEKESADYSAYSVWGVFQRPTISYTGKELLVPSLILLDADKGRWAFPELCKKVESLNAAYKPDGVIIEKKASGQSLIQEMRRRGLPVIEFNPDTDKLARVHASTPLFENQRIWFPDTDWAISLIGDLTKFPNIAKKDLVDTVSQACLWMKNAWQVSSIDPDAEDEDTKYNGKRKTYWAALTTQ